MGIGGCLGVMELIRYVGNCEELELKGGREKQGEKERGRTGEKSKAVMEMVSGRIIEI